VNGGPNTAGAESPVNGAKPGSISFVVWDQPGFAGQYHQKGGSARGGTALEDSLVPPYKKPTHRWVAAIMVGLRGEAPLDPSYKTLPF